MLMAKTISLFRCLGKSIRQPGRLLAVLNDELAETASRGMFVTMVAGVVDPASGEVAFANAGHQPPLLRNRDGLYREALESSPPLGILPGMTFDEQRLSLDGGRLYLFTDGVTEGLTDEGGMLGLSGLKARLDGSSSWSPGDQLDHVAAALIRPGSRLHDDMTMLVIGQ